MMRCRRRTLILAASCTVICMLLAWLFFPRSGRINRAGFERIEEGMTRQEVEEILGSAPGDFTVVKNPMAPLVTWLRPLDAKNWPWERQQWLSDAGEIEVTFDCEGKVIHKYFDDMQSQPNRTALEVIERFRSRIIPGL